MDIVLSRDEEGRIAALVVQNKIAAKALSKQHRLVKLAYRDDTIALPRDGQQRSCVAHRHYFVPL